MIIEIESRRSRGKTWPSFGSVRLGAWIHSFVRSVWYGVGGQEDKSAGTEVRGAREYAGTGRWGPTNLHQRAVVWIRAIPAEELWKHTRHTRRERHTGLVNAELLFRNQKTRRGHISERRKWHETHSEWATGRGNVWKVRAREAGRSELQQPHTTRQATQHSDNRRTAVAARGRMCACWHERATGKGACCAT